MRGGIHLISKHSEKAKNCKDAQHGLKAHLGQDEAVVVVVARIISFVAHGVEEQH